MGHVPTNKDVPVQPSDTQKMQMSRRSEVITMLYDGKLWNTIGIIIFLVFCIIS